MKLFSTAIAIFFGLIVFWNANAAVLTRPPNNLGLVGSWPMNEGPSTQAGDFSGNNNHGTLTQMDPNTDWVNGKRGKALDFDGSDDSVNIGDNSLLRFDSGTQDFSIFTWVKFQGGTAGGAPIFDKRDGNFDGYALFANTSGNLRFLLNSKSLTGTRNLFDNIWHYVGVVIDRDGNGQLYVDGLTEGSAVAISSEAMSTIANVVVGSNSY